MLQEFIDGKTVYTIAKTDAIAAIDKALAAEGRDGLRGRRSVLRNRPGAGSDRRAGHEGPVCDKLRRGERLLRPEGAGEKLCPYLTFEKAEDLYGLTDKMPVRLGVEYENPEMGVLLEQYENSVEVPKLTDLSNYWMEMEIAFAKYLAGQRRGGRVGRGGAGNAAAA